jgi:hypothetical protein
MKVFCDYHQGALFGSIKMLIEDRLGWELYRPIGTEWLHAGWWKVAEVYGNATETVEQFLGTQQVEWDAFKNLNGDNKLENEIYYVSDHENNIVHKAITLEKFKQMEFDLIIATHPEHGNWQELLQYQPKAKFIMQLGNLGQTTTAKNVMSSVKSYQPLDGQNVIYYHQEADLKDFYYSKPKKSNKISSFVFTLPFPEIYDLYKASLSEFEFKAYGMAARDGLLATKKDLGDKIRESRFVWHIKGADGYGHLLHQIYSCGRPVITRGSFYEGQTGGLLLEDGITCIDLDKHSFQESLNIIKNMTDEEHYLMCKNVKKKFNDVVDFEKESKELVKWIGGELC